MKKIQSFILSLIVITITTALHAIPANPHPITFTQPNNETLTVKIRGDERIHWHESIDGYTLLFNQAGYLCYAQLDVDGNLQPSAFVATDIKNRNIVTQLFLNTINKCLSYSNIQKQLMLKVWEIEDEYETKGGRAVIGQYKTLCAFVQFPEKSMVKTMSQFEGLMNQLGYTGNGTGSVRDFFKETSYDQFDLVVTLCGVYTAPNSEAYYAGNNGTQNCQALGKWAAQQVAADPNINFADYDSDNNGVVDGFHFIFAGKGQEAGGGSGTIWSHKWQFSPAVSKNGKSISVYSCSPELYNNQITTIGVICHEMTHAFGAPDFYDTDGSTGGSYDGTGNWDIMAGGSWNGSPGGNRPPHHNTYTKVQFGWLIPIVLSSPATITNMPNSAENTVAYRINTGNGNEHYLLANRQKVKFDTDIPGSGMIIYHVHSSVGTSGINATHPQRMYPVCASSGVAIPVAGASNYGTINNAGCLFPGTSNKTSFNGTSTPRMFYWTSTVINDKPITEITHNTSTKMISFKFMGGGAPPMIPVVEIVSVPNSFTAGASLTLEGTIIPSNATNQAIEWSIFNAGNTGATISNNILSATAPGALVVTATVENGTATGVPYTQNFTIIVNKPDLAGSVSITGLTVFGETLTANIAAITSNPEIPNVGTPAYQWKRGTTNIGNNNTYILVAADIGHTLTVEVTTTNCIGKIISNPTETIIKATPEKPNLPTLLIASTTYIILNTIAGCEYRRDGGNWQDTTTFNGLTPNTPYGFQIRIAETATHLASDPSEVVFFNTSSIPNYSITASVNNDEFGSITPAGVTVVEEGNELSYSINANTHYHTTSVLVNGDDIGAVNNYTFPNVTEDQTIHAIFMPNIYTVTFMANNGEGVMNPQEFTYGNVQNLTPNCFTKTGYLFVNWNTLANGDGISYSNQQSISISENLSLYAQWEKLPPIEYIILATATEGGEITPNDIVKVLEGESITFSILNANGYSIQDVLVDGVSVGVCSKYEFKEVNDNHTIHAIFSNVGMDDIGKSCNFLQINPNPANEVFQLRITNYEWKIANSERQVEFYNAFGQLVKSVPLHHEINNNEVMQYISIDDLSKGIYVIRVGTETAKLVVQ